jgi:hypothetical protein
MTDYSREIAIINALRLAFEKFKHHQNFSNRMRPYLTEALPEYYFHINVDHTQWGATQYTLGVWGNGLHHSDRISLYWTISDNHHCTWQEGFLGELDRHDLSDQQEREQDEERLLPELEKLNTEVENCVERAQKLIEKLPIPKSAKLRNEQCFWDRPSSELQKRFPFLFRG